MVHGSEKYLLHLGIRLFSALVYKQYTRVFKIKTISSIVNGLVKISVLWKSSILHHSKILSKESTPLSFRNMMRHLNFCLVENIILS